MQILVTNDDGILSEGLWILVSELQKIAQVIVVAPDREQSAVGSAVTLRQPLRIHKVTPSVPGIEAYAVDGTPSDAVILALGNLIKTKVDLVISGINQGSNLGEDVHISGTVGAALQGYLRGCPSIAISAPDETVSRLKAAAKVTAALAGKMNVTPLPPRIFLNVNMPDLPLEKINGIKLTRLAMESHINTVEEGTRGYWKYYWLVRKRIVGSKSDNTDISAIEQGNISITPLYTDHIHRPSPQLLRNLSSNLLLQIRGK
jgi:5'-nucleotidase